MNSIEVLKKCKVEGNLIKLPNTQLDRKVYMDVKKSIEKIGGKWKGGKVAGFVFSSDPTDLLSDIAGGKKRNIKQEFQFFATPSKLSERLVSLADLKDTDTILEPSAGQGAILEHINNKSNATPDCFELMGVNQLILGQSNLRYNLVGDDFLRSDDKKYSKIIANPPFSKNQDIEHVYKMFEKLNLGGRIVTIMSKHWQISTNKKETNFRMWLNILDAKITNIDSGAFKESGTSMATLIVVINKPLK